MRSKNFGRLKNTKFEFFCFTLIIVGVFIGTTGFVTGNDFSFVNYDFLEIVKNEDYLAFDVFFRSFSGNTLFLILIYISGFSAVLQPLIFACAIVKGMGLGVVVSAMYSAFGKEFIFEVFFAVVIPSLFYVFAIVIAVREAFYMSVSIARAIFTERNFIGLKDASKLYSVKFVVLVALIAFGATAECVIKSLIF